jgi:UDP-N-acetylglucosamine pyrophosphorylase
MISQILLTLVAAFAIQIPQHHSVQAFAPTITTSKTYTAKTSLLNKRLFSTTNNDANESTNNDDFSQVAFVLLAGGTGSRMKANMPKQFLELKGMPILHHSLDLFLNKLPAYAEENGMRYDNIDSIFF